jgi:hypothetical protein
LYRRPVPKSFYKEIDKKIKTHFRGFSSRFWAFLGVCRSGEWRNKSGRGPFLASDPPTHHGGHGFFFLPAPAGYHIEKQHEHATRKTAIAIGNKRTLRNCQLHCGALRLVLVLLLGTVAPALRHKPRPRWLQQAHSPHTKHFIFHPCIHAVRCSIAAFCACLMSLSYILVAA